MHFFRQSLLIIAAFLLMLSCEPETQEIQITISDVSPIEVKIGSVVTVTGAYLNQINGARIGGINIAKIDITFVSDTVIQITIPENATFPCSLVLISGNREITWDGQLTEKISDPVKDAKYAYEPTTPSIQNFDFRSYRIECKNLGDYYKVGYNIVSIHITGDQGYLQLNVVIPSGNPSFLPSGTYEIVPIIKYGEILPFRAWASNGNDNSGNPNPSYVAKSTNGGYQIFYLVEGTVNVPNPATLNINAKSYFGSTINLQYTGVILLN